METECVDSSFKEFDGLRGREEIEGSWQGAGQRRVWGHWEWPPGHVSAGPPRVQAQRYTSFWSARG